MKKNLLLAALAVLTACSSNNSEPVDNNRAELRLTSGIEVQTRATVDTEMIPNGEVVSVWVDDAGNGNSLYASNQLTADGYGNFTGGSTMYFPQTGNGVDIYAIHGTYEGTPFGSNPLTCSVPTDQSNGWGSSDLLYAVEKNVQQVSDPTVQNLTFYHLLSMVEFSITSGNGNAVLASSQAVKLNGVNTKIEFTPSKTVNMDTEEERTAMLANASESGNITLPQAMTTDANNKVYNRAIVIPQTLSNKTITFALNAGGTLTYTFPADTEFKSGYLYRYDITLTMSGLKVTSSVEPWNVVDGRSGEAVQ